jgi:hypothetical protein
MIMQRKNIKIAGILLLMSIMLMTSCSDYLDVSKELSKNLDKEEVFSNATYLKSWYGEIYSWLPNYSESGFGVQNNGAFQNLWSILSGELVCAHPNVLKYAQNTYTPSNAPSHRWWRCYEEIRQSMIFLQRAPESLGNSEDQSGYISKAEMDRMKADVTYLMAYYYFQLFELYGPTPIISNIADPEQAEIDYKRPSVDEMVNHIDSLLDELIDGKYKGVLPNTIKTGKSEDYTHTNSDYDLNNILRPTMATVLALRARLWVYAASPLFNGGYQEALALKDKDGKRLFPDYDANKWKIAKKHLEELFSFAENNGYHLYHAAPGKDGKIDPNQSIYELFQYYNDEILWATGVNDYNHVASNMEARTTPGDMPGSMGNVGPYQEMVDLFFTKNGLDIREDTTYHETGFTDYPNVCTTLSSSVKHYHIDKHIFNMYVNREPRFYADITYEGKSWHIQRDQKTYKDFGAYFSKGGKGHQDNTMYARAGYLLYKFNNRTLLNVGSNTKKWGRPWIYFRLADFYLYYAEVCNEIDPSDPNIIKYLDLVRERAGIPGYKSLAEKGIKNIIGDQQKQRNAIQHERMVEMFGEGNYYFDTHRWMTAGYSKDTDGNWIKNNDDKSILRTGMDIKQKACEFNSKGIPTLFYDKTGTNSYFNRVVVDELPWIKAMLLYPVPYNEMQKSKLIVQNPLWD